MKPEHHASIIRLNAQIIEVQNLVFYWMSITDPSMFKEAASELAKLKVELASLRMEQKAFLNDL
jgi:hypothetical protein